MRPRPWWLCLILIAIPSAVQGAGFARNENFMVLAKDQELAEEILARADDFRKEIAKEWLGAELPPSVGPAVITVTLSDEEDRGSTWAVDGPHRKHHRVWLTTSRDRATGATLRHEITHTVLATRYPGVLPLWTDEGAASLSDDSSRQKTRAEIIDWYAKTGNWPSLARLFGKETMRADDQAGYGVAASVTSFLLTKGDRATFLDFAIACRKEGSCGSALGQHYRINGVAGLQAAWEAWAANRTTSRVAAARAIKPVRAER